MSIKGTGHPALEQFNQSCSDLQAMVKGGKVTIATDPLLCQLKHMEWPTGGSASSHTLDSYWEKQCNSKECNRLLFFLVGIVLNLNSRAFNSMWNAPTLEKGVEKVGADPHVLVTRVNHSSQEECFVALRRRTEQVFSLAYDSVDYGTLIFTEGAKPPEKAMGELAFPLARRFLAAVQAIDADEQESCKVALASYLSGAPYLLVLEYVSLPSLLHVAPLPKV